jgi:hypothetical protein
MQVLAHRLVKDEGLPEDEREKIEVTNLFLINYTLLKLALFYSSNSLPNFAATFL